MRLTSEQLDRFFKGLCSEEEAAKITEYLKEEWQDADGLSPLPGELSDVMFREIADQAFEKKKVNKIVWAAVAASVLLLISFGLFQKNNSKPAMLASLQQTEKDTVNRNAGILWQEKRNTTAKKEMITLSDGSIVHLFKNSAIRFKQPFVQAKREIVLEGHASFEVAKHQGKPFIVYAGDTKTTVLGTSFNIAQDDHRVTVKLYSGKVMIEPTGQGPVYLSPGQQMKYDKGNVSVSASEEKESNSDYAEQAGTLSFNSTPISKVLNALSGKYKVPLMYERKELDKIYFSGSVLPTDSLLTILQVMCSMNGLTISQQHDTIIIRKSHH